MKKILFFTLAAAVAVIIAVPGAWAQESAADEFTLEEIMVTAEKREVNVQSIPASVHAVSGDDLVVQGKVTAAQILENIPNLVYSEPGRDGGPYNNITIRGVKKTQEPGGGSPVPSATATYVDGVYDGIGGNFDINRVEVLRGPQGTLYGRSATGGVVSFHTNNPQLEQVSVNVMAEYGTASRINTQGAVNVPVGEKVALRAAVHYLRRDEGYFLNDEGGKTETKEGRIKALYQPSENLSAVLSLSASRVQSNSGGWAHTLSGPNDIVYDGNYTEVSEGVPTKYSQGSLEVNYDFGDSTLTYIAAMHTMDNRGKGGPGNNRGSIQQNETSGEPAETQTHEVRWASDSEGPLTWLIGANYYGYDYDRKGNTIQVSQVGDDDPNTFNAFIFGQLNKGDIKDYGIFTEETFELRDDMRITGGLRYDKTKINNYSGFDFNKNLKPNGASLNPPDIVHYPEIGGYVLDNPEFDNVTYKLRFEYDLTPDNMLYALTSTGFLPGSSQISPAVQMGPDENGNFVVTGVEFRTLPYEQEKLTAYEIGSKNRFLDNRLQLNGALFYFDYEGYQESVNIKPAGSPPPPEFVVLRVPVEMYGLEVDMAWLLTSHDKVTFSGGWLDAQLTSYPDIPGVEPGTTQSAEEFMYLKRVPGLPEVTATLSYDHTFLFANGSALAPRVEANYTSGYYLAQATREEAEQGWLPYLHQGSTVLVNLGATWTSPQDRYSMTAYLRNAADEEYKTGVTLPTGPNVTNVTVGDPRTFGVMLNAKF